jgi:hypothetical protein
MNNFFAYARKVTFFPPTTRSKICYFLMSFNGGHGERIYEYFKIQIIIIVSKFK